MKVPEVVTFSFDPRISLNPALLTWQGRVLWACVKTGHLTDQHFNDNVAHVIRQIQENMPAGYDEFRTLINAGPLAKFGTVSDPDRSCYNHTVSSLDDEFWGGIWLYLTRDKLLDIKVKIKGVPQCHAYQP